MAYVDLGSMPSAKREYSVSFEKLSGGLNLRELDYRIGNDETPEMKNMLWREGVLCCRDGQIYVNPEAGDEFRAAHNRIWNGRMIIHSGNKLYSVNPETGIREEILDSDGSSMDCGESKGRFFPYGEKLYYKSRGHYVSVSYDETQDTFSVSNITGYCPVTYINASPYNGSGTVYQPENRLSPDKTIWYNAAYTLNAVATGDLTAVIEDASFRSRITTPGRYTFVYTNSVWKLNNVAVDPLDYGIAISGIPVDGDTVIAVFVFISEYYLPVKNVEIRGITVDGVSMAEESIVLTPHMVSATVVLTKEVWSAKIHTSGSYNFVYDYDTPQWILNGTPLGTTSLAEYGIATSGVLRMGDSILVEYDVGDYRNYPNEGKILFFDPPVVTFPETNNTVHITYTKDNPTAYDNIMDCEYAEVYGGTGALCIVMAGSKTQPNAYFWNGQTDIAMDAAYFPMTQYQLAGDATDPVTGFGKQQGFLIIFKESSIGRTTLSVSEVEGRSTIDLPYVPINAKIGCNLPDSIQLIENNLTWCNTESGIHFLANTSAAYENNVICISDKINYSSATWTRGLLYDIRRPEKVIVSHDDEKRYWLVVGDHVWLWDYTISNYKNPAWFYFDKIRGEAFVQESDDVWHFDHASRLTHMENVYYDYDPSANGSGAIDKVFRFATQYFGTYDNYKNINSVIINTRSDTLSEIELEYQTDYETRKDKTSLIGSSWLLIPRNLERRDLSGSGFAHVFRRKPHCWRVRYFTMRLENNKPMMDMTIVSAQVYYNFQGRQR